LPFGFNSTPGAYLDPGGTAGLIRVFLAAGMLNSFLLLNRPKRLDFTNFLLSKPSLTHMVNAPNKRNGPRAKLWVRQTILRHRVTQIRQSHMVVEQVEKIFSLVSAVAVDGIEHVFGEPTPMSKLVKGSDNPFACAHRALLKSFVRVFRLQGVLVILGHLDRILRSANSFVWMSF